MNKIVAIHQPNYLPWIGYFYKMMKADCFVLFDNAQYPKGSVCNRNKIKTPEGSKLLTVPVRISKGHLQKINEIEVIMAEKWNEKHWKTIITYYGKAQYFKQYIDAFEDIFKKKEWASLAELNKALIILIKNLLGLKTQIVISSDLDINGKVNNLSICKALDASTYLSGDGSMDYLDEDEFSKEGISVTYTNFMHPGFYKQLFNDFIPNLSILDLLLNCGPESIKIIESAQNKNCS